MMKKIGFSIILAIFVISGASLSAAVEQSQKAGIELSGTGTVYAGDKVVFWARIWNAGTVPLSKDYCRVRFFVKGPGVNNEIGSVSCFGDARIIAGKYWYSVEWVPPAAGTYYYYARVENLYPSGAREGISPWAKKTLTVMAKNKPMPRAGILIDDVSDAVVGDRVYFWARVWNAGGVALDRGSCRVRFRVTGPGVSVDLGSRSCFDDRVRRSDGRYWYSVSYVPSKAESYSVIAFVEGNDANGAKVRISGMVSKGFVVRDKPMPRAGILIDDVADAVVGDRVYFWARVWNAGGVALDRGSCRVRFLVTGPGVSVDLGSRSCFDDRVRRSDGMYWYSV